MIDYKSDIIPDTKQIIELYQSSGINRPIDDFDRISKMYSYSNLIVTAWNLSELVGIARSLTDFCYCCYLSDLAVKKEYQHQGVGRKLISLTKEIIGPKSMLLLLSAKDAMNYYPKIGFQAVDNGFIIKRN